MADLTPYQRVQRYFEPDLSRKNIADEFYNDTARKNASEIWKNASDSERRGLIVKAVNNTPQLLQEGETESDFLESVEKEMPVFAPEQSFEQQGQQEQSPDIPGGPLQERENSGSTSSAESGHAGDVATSAIHTLQEQQLLETFNAALRVENTPQNPNARADAIQNVLDSLDAPKLFGNQIDIIKEHILDTERVGQQFKGQDKQSAQEEIAKQLREIAEQRQKKIAVQDETEEGKKAKTLRDAEDEKLHQQVLLESNKNPSAARDIFQNLARRRIAETTRQYYVLEGYDNSGNYGILFALSQLLRAQAIQNAQIQQAQAEQENDEEEVQQQASIQQTRANQQAIAQGQQGRAAQGAAKKAAGKAIKKGVETAAKALGPEAQIAEKIGWWLFEFIKKHKFLTAIIVALLVILAFLPLIILIVVIVSVFNGQNNTSPGNVPQDVSSLVTVVVDVETCEKTSIGTFHPPIPLCLLALRLSNIINGGPNVDLQGFIDDVNSGYPHFQCGQFIWAAQRFVLDWPVFPGNVGTVFQWYTQYKNTMPGYNWIDNPDSPGLVPLPYRNSRSNWVDAPANILPGDIILYGAAGSGDPGHIAIVTLVQSDDFNIVVTEANYHEGAIDLRPTNLNDGLGRGAWILGWWRKNSQ